MGATPWTPTLGVATIEVTPPSLYNLDAEDWVAGQNPPAWGAEHFNIDQSGALDWAQAQYYWEGVWTETAPLQLTFERQIFGYDWPEILAEDFSAGGLFSVQERTIYNYGLENEITSPWSTSWSDTLDPVVAGNTHAYRYYRLLVSAPTVGSGTAFVEMELSETAGGADTTSGQTATASSSFGGAPASSAIDDNNATFWASDFGGSWPQWIKIDYGATAGNWKAINQLKIKARNAGDEAQAPQNFVFQGSDDNAAWTDLITQTDQFFSADEIKTWVV